MLQPQVIPYGLFVDSTSAPWYGEFELNPEDSAKYAKVANRTELAEGDT